MTDQIKIPGIGPVHKKWAYVGGALAAGIVGYAWWTRGVADSAEGGQDGTVEDTGEYGAGVDSYVSPVPGGSTVPSGTGTDPADLPPTTNAIWSQRVIESLASIGWDAQAVTTALGLYLNRQSMTKSQAEIVRAALAVMGPPPVGTFPINIIPDPPVKPPTTTPPTTKPPTTTPPASKPPAAKPPAAKPPAKPAGPPKARATAIARPGDNLSKIAARYHTTWQVVYKFNTTPGVRPASTIATIKKRGPNLIYAGSLWKIPPVGWK